MCLAIARTSKPGRGSKRKGKRSRDVVVGEVVVDFGGYAGNVDGESLEVERVDAVDSLGDTFMAHDDEFVGAGGAVESAEISDLEVVDMSMENGVDVEVDDGEGVDMSMMDVSTVIDVSMDTSMAVGEQLEDEAITIADVMKLTTASQLTPAIERAFSHIVKLKKQSGKICMWTGGRVRFPFYMSKKSANNV